MKFLFFLFLNISAFAAFCQSDSLNIDSNETWTGPITKDVSYKGNETLMEFININLSNDVKIYLKRNKIKARLYYMLVIDKVGRINEVQLKKGEIDPYINEEIIRVLKLTTWSPAIAYDTPVIRRIMLPIFI